MGEQFSIDVLFFQLKKFKLLIILIMDIYENSLRIQLRIERCTLKIITVPADYAFILINGTFKINLRSFFVINDSVEIAREQ